MFLILLTLVVNTGGAIFIEYSWRLSKWNPPLVMILVESLKCLISIILWRKTGISFSTKYIFHFAIPGALYSILNICNSYAFNIFPSHFIITVANLKIIWSMLLAKYFLKQTFSRQQWFAGALILVGLCVISTQSDGQDTNMFVAVAYGIFSSLVSSITGTYCEYLYKLEPEETIYAQNVKLYAFCTLFNVLIFALRGNIPDNWHWSVNIIVIYYVFAGIVVSFVMKYLGNVVRNILGAITMVLVSLCSVVLLDNKITYNFITGATIVISGSLTYNFNKPTPTTVEASKNNEEKESLLAVRSMEWGRLK